MKKIFFLFAMFANIAASAQNVQVETISATYTSTPNVKFRVTWTGARAYRHNTKVWVFVDYRKVENNVPAGGWARALVASTPTVSSSSASTVTLEPGNDKGFWLQGTNGYYSATVTVPLTLAAGVMQFSWCAYATDYPPNVVVHSTSSYTLRGSPPFVINGATLPVSQSTFSGTIISFTDATSAPGLFPAALNEQPNEMGCVAGLVENMNGVCVEPSAAGCTNNSLNLGTVSFTAGTEIKIVGDNISQIWSRPVIATNCHNKTSFNGGLTGTYYADCRNNPGYAGDLFSGCAMIRYAAQLCPKPWRMPTKRDFVLMLEGLGASSTNVVDKNFIQTKLIGTWGAEWNGIGDNGGLAYQKSRAEYGFLKLENVDVDEIDRRYRMVCLVIVSDNVIYETDVAWTFLIASERRHAGFTVRCVKD
ncbi:MAG: hypothetical protein LBF81_03550 [Prevotellaceae bacterium]|jgi:uncharacterized protein (TIGR02145 family)|nr:hypothetical protein [Prevotellaceae bacterium]